MTAPGRLKELERMRLVYGLDSTSHEQKVEIGLIVRGYAEEAMPDSRCRICGHAGVHIPDERPRFEGHCYTERGVTEYTRMTRYCESCFDKLMLDPDDVRRAEWWPEEYVPFYTCGRETPDHRDCDFETFDKVAADAHETGAGLEDHWIVTGSWPIGEKP